MKLDFFARSKALRKKAIKTPYTWDGSSLYTEKGENFVSFDCTEYTGEYIVHCVNTHERLCDIVEEYLNYLRFEYGEESEHFKEIKAALEEMSK